MDAAKIRRRFVRHVGFRYPLLFPRDMVGPVSKANVLCLWEVGLWDLLGGRCVMLSRDDLRPFVSLIYFGTSIASEVFYARAVSANGIGRDGMGWWCWDWV